MINNCLDRQRGRVRDEESPTTRFVRDGFINIIISCAFFFFRATYFKTKFEPNYRRVRPEPTVVRRFCSEKYG